MNSAVNRQAFKIQEACEYLGGISASSLRRLVKAKKVKRILEFRHLVVTKESCDRFLAES